MVTIDQGGARAKTLRLIRPSDDVAPFVEFVWVDDGPPRDPTSAAQWRIVADDASHVIYSETATIGGTRRSRLNLVGPRSGFADLDLTTRMLTVGVRLRPGAASALFGFPAHETTDRSLPLMDVVPRALRSMAARIDGEGPQAIAPNMTALVRMLSLLARSPDPRSAWLATQDAIRETDLDQLAHAFGISHRGLRAWSHRTLGMGVKRFLRIQRLHRAIRLRQREPKTNWGRIAARAGYADQSHCIREFRDLLGETPSAFVARGGSPSIDYR